MRALEPIGVIRTPFGEIEGTPIQPAAAAGARGTVEVFEAYRAGLKDLDGFSHVILLYLFHKSRGYQLEVLPFMDTEPHGLFSTRAPRRPNAIGLSILELDRIDQGTLHVRNVDILDGTPLLDIKPYVPSFECCTEVNSGWVTRSRKTVTHHKADDRFRS